MRRKSKDAGPPRPKTSEEISDGAEEVKACLEAIRARRDWCIHHIRMATLVALLDIDIQGHSEAGPQG